MVKNPPASTGDARDKEGFSPWVRKIPWNRRWKPTPVFLPKKSHGQRSLAGYSPQECEELDMAEHTHTYTEYCFLTHGPFSDFTKHPINIFYSKSKKKKKFSAPGSRLTYST